MFILNEHNFFNKNISYFFISRISPVFSERKWKRQSAAILYIALGTFLFNLLVHVFL